MYRRNRPMAGFPVFEPAPGRNLLQIPQKRAKRRRHPDRQSAARILISLRWHDPNQVAGKDHGGLLSARQYGLPVVQFRLLYAPFPDFATVLNKKTGGAPPVFPHRFTEMALTGQPLAASNTRLSRFFSGAPVTRDTRPTMANTSGTAAAHIPQPMHRRSSILICIRVSSSVCSGLVGAVFPHYSLLRRSPTRPFSCGELFGRCFVRKKEHFSGRNGGFVSGSAFTLFLFCAILKNIMLTTLETDGGSL